MANLFPSVEILNGSDVSPAAQLEEKNRIGIVGAFTKGPAEYTELFRYDDFRNVYGADLSPGSLFVKAASDAGASNFGIIRVMAHKRPSTATLSLTGSQVLSDANLSLKLKKLALSIGSLTTLGRPTTKQVKFVFAGTYVAGDIITISINSLLYQYVVTTRNSIRQIVAAIYNLIKTKSPDYKAVVGQTTVTGDTITLTATAPGTTITTSVVENSVAGTITTTVLTANTSDTSVTLNSASSYAGSEEGVYTLSIGTLTATTYPATLQFTSKVTGVTYNRTPVEGISISNTAPSAAVVVPDGSTSLQFMFTTAVQTDAPATTLLLQPGAEVRVDVAPEKTIVLPVSAGEPIPTVINRLVENIQSLPQSQTGIAKTEKVGIKSLKLTSVEEGASANYIRYVLSVDVANAVGFQTAADFFAGGREGAKTAARVLYANDIDNTPILGLAALTQGSYGNSLQFAIQPLTEGRFKITCTDLMALSKVKTEEFIVNLNNFNQDGTLTDVSNSGFFAAYLIPQIEKFDNGTDYDPILLSYQPVRLAATDNSIAQGSVGFDESSASYILPTYGNPFTLTGGSDGEEITEEDYLEAISKIGQFNCRIISAAGQGSDSSVAIYNALLSVAEKSTPQTGIKFAVLCAPKGLKASQAKALTSGLGIDSRSGAMVAGWTTYQGIPSLPELSMPPDGIYAGRLATYPRHVSPAANIGSRLRNITATDLESDDAALNEYTANRVDGIFFDQALQRFGVLNGRTLSTLPEWYSISVQRIFDEIAEDAYINLQWAKALPNDPALRSKIADSLDAYLLTKLRAGAIGAYSPTVCNSSNNTLEDTAKRRVNAAIRVTPLFPADNIYVYVIRELKTTTTITL